MLRRWCVVSPIFSFTQTSYKRDLIEDLKSETSGCFKDLLVALTLSPGDFDALTAHKAIEGLGTDDSTLIELLCSRTPAEINALKIAYQERKRGRLFILLWPH